tara:strand:- start:74 stop:337 length:264 start_codon:yes stop_codon:yes gene_type:complete
VLELIFNKLWIFAIGWFWYDKRKSDDKAKEDREQIKNMQTQINENKTNQLVSEEKLDSIITLVNSKIDPLTEDVRIIKQLIMSNNNK